MPRIEPLSKQQTLPAVQEAYDKHVQEYHSRITNMKATLAHSLIAFEVYMQWYSLYERIKQFVGERPAYLYAFSISQNTNCPLCSAYFRKIIIDNGEDPAQLQLRDDEQLLLDFGNAIAINQGHIDDELFNRISEKYTKAEVVELIAFAGQMIATNIFNNVIETEIDEYLLPYAAQQKTAAHV
jgi:alkylhydroperoxidase family enzyme